MRMRKCKAWARDLALIAACVILWVATSYLAEAIAPAAQGVL